MSPVQSGFTTYEPLRRVRLGIIVPLRLTVVVCEAAPFPSNMITPTSATCPTGPAKTIDPVAKIPCEPRKVSSEHAGEEESSSWTAALAAGTIRTTRGSPRR